MAKTVPLDRRTLEWARSQFATYYASASLEPPARLARREFAAFPFTEETLMRRHASFATREAFQAYFPKEVPRHIYYSSAYYRHPAHPSMAAKEWLGADLIFDLDADHLRNAEGLGYAQQLSQVKEKLKLLVDDFLFGDFGVDPSSTSIVFSGGRGYHVHVRDEAFLGLRSPERRELVEYVLGVGFDPTATVVTQWGTSSTDPSPGGASDGRAQARRFKSLPPPSAPGWGGRTTRAVFRLLSRWEAQGPTVAAAEMAASGIPPTKARRWAKLLVDQGKGRHIRESLSLEVFPGGVPKEFLDAVLRQASIEVQGETDAPVTTDIHRLIRLPGSLHGGTGFRVVPLDRSALDRFEPLRDAYVPSRNGEQAKVEYRESVDYLFDDRSISGISGKRTELPTAWALFLVLRGEAALLP